MDWLTEQMTQKDCVVSSMHGDMDQLERNLVLQEFRGGRSRVLIATDILARGIDVQTVSLVVNYDLPMKRENYIHRIGRSGRYGRKGVAISFITQTDVSHLQAIEQYFCTAVVEMPLNVAELL